MIADGDYRGTVLLVPHRRERGQAELPAWKEEHNGSHRKVRARVQHVFARMKSWKIHRDCPAAAAARLVGLPASLWPAAGTDPQAGPGPGRDGELPVRGGAKHPMQLTSLGKKVVAVAAP